MRTGTAMSLVGLLGLLSCSHTNAPTQVPQANNQPPPAKQTPTTPASVHATQTTVVFPTSPAETKAELRPPSATTPTVLSSLTVSGPQQTAENFLVAAFTLNEQALRAVTHPSYQNAAVSLWIAATDDYTNPGTTIASIVEAAPIILASKVISNAAGQARVAVFVDSDDLAVAALPYTVELIEYGGRWVVLDAGLPTR
jgi:hypothetical protein